MKKEKIIKAGKIASEVKTYAKTIAKPGISLLELAEKIESRIIELGGKLAFPCNLSINEIAAHYTPSYDDKTLAHGLLKIDFGAHVDGYISDTAFSVDLENNEENKKLIEASKKALENVSKLIKKNQTTDILGAEVQKTIENLGFSPVINLTGHQIEKYELHAGLTIPNIDDKRKFIINEGVFAIEPFATNGSGRVRDGKASEIYMLIDERMPRSPIAREVLEFIIEEYQTLPFCSRWLVKRFGTKALFGLRQLDQNGNLHNFPQLVETTGSKVSQAENTFLVEKDKVTVTTE